MEIDTDAVTSSSSLPGDLISALEHATLMTKQLPVVTPNPSHLLQIHAALHSAHRHLSLFLHSPPQPPYLPITHPQNSVVDEPMQIADEQDSRAVEKVEGRMRECPIRNKRLKRPRSYENAAALGAGEFDPVGNKLRSLDLIYQFHA